MRKLLRTLTWFSKKGDELAGELPLRGATLGDLQKLFAISEDDPMYDCYPVKRKHVPEIQKWVATPIDLKKFDYFVECTAVAVKRANPKARQVA